MKSYAKTLAFVLVFSSSVACASQVAWAQNYRWNGGRGNYRGQIAGRPGYHTGSGQYHDPRRKRVYRGNYNYQNPRSYTVGGQYGNPDPKKGTMYGGFFRRNGDQTTLGGSVDSPGTMPGTRERYNGQFNYRGRDSSIQGGGQVYSGNRQLAGRQMYIDRRKYSQQGSAGYGNVRKMESSQLNFRGLNSSYQSNETRQFANNWNIQNGFNANRNGVGYNYGATVNGQKIGIGAQLGQNGVRVNATAPRINLPKIQTPKVTAPRISTPRVSSPRISAPKVSAPRVSVPKVTVPKVTVPKVKVPKVKVPKIRTPW